MSIGAQRSANTCRLLVSASPTTADPVLWLLWQARPAEGATQTSGGGSDTEPACRDRVVWVGRDRERRRPDPVRGPLLAVIDAGGLVHALPETAAESVVLDPISAALRGERRRTLSASADREPNETHELTNSRTHELTLSGDGIGRLLVLPSMSVHVGTELDAPVRMPAATLRDAASPRSHVLLLSDGGFSAHRDLAGALTVCGYAGRRVGVRGRCGLGRPVRAGNHRTRETVHDARDRAALGGGAGA